LIHFVLLQQLNMPEPVCSPEERLKQMLKILDTFCLDSSSAAEMQQLANEAKRVVNKMQNFLERSLVEEVAELVQAEQWRKAGKKIEQNFPNGLNIGKVEEILEHIFLVNGTLKHLLRALTWVMNLDVQLQSRAYEALYEQLKFKKLTGQPHVLVLKKLLDTLSVAVSDQLRTQLDEDFQTIVGQIVEGLKTEDYSLSLKIYEVVKSLKGFSIMNEIVTAVVGKFETFTLENTLLLIQYSSRIPAVVIRCFLMDAMMKKIEVHELQSSVQAFHVWSVAKYDAENCPNWRNVPKETQKLCTDVLDKLAEHKVTFFQYYQKYVEDQDKQKLINIHTRNCTLYAMVSDFATWYYKKDDLTRAQKLLSTARAINSLRFIERILTPLQNEMHKFQQMNTFEAFCLFNMVKYYMAHDHYKTYAPTLKASFEELKAKAPTCFRLLLWPDENQLQLVNKFFDSPLCIQQDKIVCSNSSLDKDLLCSATVDPKTALTTFSFTSGAKSCKLDAAALEDIKTKKPWIGTQWKVKAVDDTHVKIFTDDGE
jgi:hypothetical protein